MEKERIVFLDAIKAIAIFLVVFCHYVTLPSDTIIGNAIMSLAWCAVPCFFMVTGSLLHSKVEFSMKKHMKRILVTYLVMCCWKLLYFVFSCVITEVHFSKAELLEYLFIFGDIDNVNVGHVWFMYAYILILLFYPISYYIMKSDNNALQIYTVILLFFGGIGIPAMQFVCTTLSQMIEINSVNVSAFSNVLPFGRYVNMLFYFLAGGLIFNNKEKINKIKNEKGKIFAIVLILVGILGNMAIKFTYTHSFQWQGSYLIDGYGRFPTLLMTFGLYILCFVIGDCKFFKMLAKFIGKETMGIYYLHMPVLNIFSIFVFPYLYTHYSFGLNVLKTVVCILLCVFCSKIIKKVPYLCMLVK